MGAKISVRFPIKYGGLEVQGGRGGGANNFICSEHFDFPGCCVTD